MCNLTNRVLFINVAKMNYKVKLAEFARIWSRIFVVLWADLYYDNVEVVKDFFKLFNSHHKLNM